MRKLLAVATSSVLLAAGVATPAWAAEPAPPSNVKVSWSGDQIRVTWQDNGEANGLNIRYADQGVYAGKTTADAPNEIVLSPSIFRDRSDARVGVWSDAADGGTSGWGNSPVFDSRQVAKPLLFQATSLSATSVRLRWNQDEVADTTPNDIMDKPAGDWLKATVTGPAAGQRTETLIPAGTHMANVPVPAGQVTIKLSAGNEWGVAPARDYQTARVGTMRVSSTLPAMTSFPGFSFKGTLQMSEPPQFGGVNFDVQVRPNSAAPWQTIGSGVSAEKPGTAIPAYTGASGGREYRLWVAPTEGQRDDVLLVSPAASTSAKFIRRNTAIYRATFSPATAQVSATVKLIVNVEPHVAMKAALQKWDGKKWVYLRAVQLDSKGNASLAIRAAGRGTTTKYRIATPPLKVNGLPVEVSTSKPFTLTVR